MWLVSMFLTYNFICQFFPRRVMRGHCTDSSTKFCTVHSDGVWHIVRTCWSGVQRVSVCMSLPFAGHIRHLKPENKHKPRGDIKQNVVEEVFNSNFPAPLHQASAASNQSNQKTLRAALKGLPQLGSVLNLSSLQNTVTAACTEAQAMSRACCVASLRA